jgi:iron complex outermembrane recepter protein
MRGCLGAILGYLCWVGPAFAQAEPAPAPAPSTVESNPPTEAGPPAEIVSPRVTRRVDAVYPPAVASRGARGTVVLRVTIEASGQVGPIDVVEAPDPLLVEAAVGALQQWTFEPARRDAVPVAARILVPFTFEPPSPAPPPPAAPVLPAPVARAEARAPEPPPPEAATGEVLVVGKRDAAAAPRSASDYHMHRDVLAAAPHSEGAEVLRAAPGLYLARPEGGAVAHRYVLRGFDSDHGQDIEFKVGGIPVNLPSHIHGQGYADLGFLIAETVDGLRVMEGVHDPRQGDFAVAGSIDVDLAVRQRGILLKGGYGSFGTIQALGLWAPQAELADTFGAVNFEQTLGFGPNRKAAAGSAVLQYGFSTEHWRYALLGILRAARAESPGVVRKDDVEAGRVDFYGVYPLPTAEGQNALNERLIVGLRGNYTGDDGDTGGLGLWSSIDGFALRENFTGFLERSQTLAGVYGRGDLIAQNNLTRSLGFWANYRTAPRRLPFNTEFSLELGASGRLDQVDQTQNLLDASVRGQSWDRRVDASILGVDLGGYGDLDVHVGEAVRVRVGMRADALSYDVNDRLGNFTPLSRAQDQSEEGYRRSAFGLALGPRASADFDLISSLTLHAAYGEGYRSPQARLLEDGESAPFTKVRSVDLGLRFVPVDYAHFSLSAYQTDLSDDVAFDAAEGRLSRVGKTRRRGAALEMQATPWPGVIGALSCTYVNAELMEPPPATPENPTPQFKAGQNLPFVPPLVVRADVGASHELFSDIIGKLGLGLSVLSARPLPYGDSSPAVALLDGSLGARWKMFGLSLAVFNLLDARYSSLELTFPSHWDPDSPPSRLPARHQIAGSPRALMATLEVQL